MTHTHILLLTGTPGVGKTTVIRKVAALLAERQIAGLYTEEIRSRGQRQGFRLVSLDGRKTTMAHVSYPKTNRVGKYGVNIAAIDAFVTDTLTVDSSIDVYLVDEIGKMECLSSQFVAAMQKLLDTGEIVVATIAKQGSGFIADVKYRQDTELWEVDHGNRDAMPETVIRWLVERQL